MAEQVGNLDERQTPAIMAADAFGSLRRLCVGAVAKVAEGVLEATDFVAERFSDRAGYSYLGNEYFWAVQENKESQQREAMKRLVADLSVSRDTLDRWDEAGLTSAHAIDKAVGLSD